MLQGVVIAYEGATRYTDQSKLAWQNMFKAVKCGSGSQTEVEGWFTKLFRGGAGKAPRYASNYAPHVAKVDYDLIDTGQTFTMLQGLFGSTLGPNGIAVPEFGTLVFETTK